MPHVYLHSQKQSGEGRVRDEVLIEGPLKSHLHPAQAQFDGPDLVLDELDEFHEFVDGVGDRIQFPAGIVFASGAPGAFLDLRS